MYNVPARRQCTASFVLTGERFRKCSTIVSRVEVVERESTEGEGEMEVEAAILYKE